MNPNALKSSLPVVAVLLLSGAGLLMASPVIVMPPTAPKVAAASPVIVMPPTAPRAAVASPGIVMPPTAPKVA